MKSEAELIAVLKKMRLSGMAQELERQFKNPNEDLRPWDDRVSDLIESEWNLRQTKKINRLIKDAHLNYPEACLDEQLNDPQRQLDFNSILRLSKCTWVEEHRNILITGLTGAGKTYCADALALCAIRRGYRVKSYKANRLLEELKNAEEENGLYELIDKLSHYEVLIIDDFGLNSLSIDKCRNLFELIDSREGRLPMIVVSQLPVKNWYDLFKEGTFADACLDRLLHKAYRLEFNGISLRR